MAVYDVKIESSEGEIFFGMNNDNEGGAIKNVVFKMNTLKSDTLNRDDSVRCELILEGNINKETKAETLKLAKWAMTKSGESVLYRKVTVIVYTDGERAEVLRQYIVDKMFCIDYDEIFEKSAGNKEEGSFVLRLAQREGNHSKDAFSN